MIDNQRTRDYLKSLDAVLVDEKIIIQVLSKERICIFTRKYYKKRNNKICYVDINSKSYENDWAKIVKRKKYHTIELNEHYSYNYSQTKLYPNKEYKEELINRYNNETKI